MLRRGVVWLCPCFGVLVRFRLGSGSTGRRTELSIVIVVAQLIE